jgi:hypothetical protein
MNIKKELCAACAGLEGADRHTEPHQKMKEVNSRRCSSMMGPADETYYVCLTCGQEWLHETGSCGMGWIK